MKDTISLIAFAAVFFAAAAVPVYYVQKYQCKSQWQDSNFYYRFKLIGGCQIKTDQAGWIPAKNYRDGM
jgi:hypothetical protein